MIILRKILIWQTKLFISSFLQIGGKKSELNICICIFYSIFVGLNLMILDKAFYITFKSLKVLISAMTTFSSESIVMFLNPHNFEFQILIWISARFVVNHGEYTMYLYSSPVWSSILNYHDWGFLLYELDLSTNKWLSFCSFPIYFIVKPFQFVIVARD